MKDYKEYMDKIQVSDNLHGRIMNIPEGQRAKKGFPFRQAAAGICVCLALAAVVALYPGAEDKKTGPGQAAEDTEGSSGHQLSLNFHEAAGAVSADIAIPGHFWRDLKEEEIAEVFPGLAGEYAVSATINYTTNEAGEGSIFNIDMHTDLGDGNEAYIQASPRGEVVMCYVLDVETTAEEIVTENGRGTVTAGYFEGDTGIFFAYLTVGGTEYYLEVSGGKDEKRELEEMIYLLADQGQPDYSPLAPTEIPEMTDRYMDINQARQDEMFGEYLPESSPEGFVFEQAHRFKNQEWDQLSAFLVSSDKGYEGGNISWTVSRLEENDKQRLTAVEDIENYDLGLYPTPRGETVPRELWQIVDDPIFRAGELTLQTVEKRLWKDDEGKERMMFSVLYGDRLVSISAEGVTAGQIYDMLTAIGQ